MKILCAILLTIFLSVSRNYTFGSGFENDLEKIKTASYYDSTSLFKMGYKIIAKATKEKRSDVVAWVYIYFGNYCYYTANFEKAKEFYNKAKVLSQRKYYSPIYQLAQLRINFIEIEENGNKDDIIKIKEQIKLAKHNNDSTVYLEGLNSLGIIAEEYTDYTNAVKYYLEGLAYADSIKSKNYIGIFRNNLGLVRLNQNKTNEALEDFKIAYQNATITGNIRLASHAAINWCLILMEQKKFLEADSILNSVLKYLIIQNNPLELASVYINVGNINASMTFYEKAIDYYNRAIDLISKHRFYYALVKAFAAKAEALIKLKRFAEADFCIKELEKNVKHHNSLENQIILHQTKYFFDYNRNNMSRAHETYIKLKHLQDSLNSINNSKQLNELYLKYKVKDKEIELEKSKNQSLQLSQKLEQEKYRYTLTISISIIVLLTITLAFYIHIARLKRIKQGERSKALIRGIDDERARIARDLHDELGPSLSLIKTQLSALRTEDNKENISLIQHRVDEAMSLTRSISKRIFPTILEKVGLERSIADLLEQTQSATGIECSFEFDKIFEQLSIEHKTHFFRISSECINNTIKHSGATALRIEFLKRKSSLILVYKDNGIGLREKKSFGVGFSSIKQRADMLGGSLKLLSGNPNGLVIIIKFKYDFA